MQQYSFLVIGQGSIGQRHARLLQKHGEVKTVSSVAAGSFRSVSEALFGRHYTHAVVANMTSHHASTVSELARCGFKGHVLLEKPACSNSSEISQLVESSKAFAGVSVGYNLRFHPVIQALRRSLQGKKVIEARLSVGQLLSEWRPGSDYRDGSSAKKSAGGGALRDLSHELDLALSIFGPWKRLVALGGNFQRLGIETDEAWSIIMETEHCAMVSISMNYFDQPGNRSIKATTDDASIVADLTEGRFTARGLCEDFVVERDYTYQLSHEDFIEQRGQSCTLADGIAVVRLMDAIEKSDSQRNWIEA